MRVAALIATALAAIVAILTLIELTVAIWGKL